MPEGGPVPPGATGYFGNKGGWRKMACSPHYFLLVNPLSKRLR